MQIIGLMGAMGSGKETTADIVAQLSPGVARAAFADALRLEIAAAWGIDVRSLYWQHRAVQRRAAAEHHKTPELRTTA